MQTQTQSLRPIRPIQPEPNFPRLRVAVCIATYRRPHMLRELLEGISKLRFLKFPAPDLIVIVVDNDPARSAEDICRASSLPWRLKYTAEPRRGIPQARNRSIREAESADFIAFIDDDEYPSTVWLDELLWTQAKFGADVVCGPILPDFDDDVPNWVRAGKFFDRGIQDSGKATDACRTGNSLVRKALFDHLSLFDERFALTGGEDTQFFLRVRQSGFTMVSSGHAFVHEPIPRSRGNLRWLLRRAYQSGNSWVLCEKSLDQRKFTRLIRFVKGCGRMAQGALTIPVSAIRGKAALARALRNIALGAGMLSGLAGRRYEPYRSAGANVTTAL
jgi:succinoglycan biosynthesis protein ExoM